MGGLVQSDVYQLMAYARVYRCERLMLLFPAEPGAGAGLVRSFGLAQGRERLDIATVDLACPARSVVRQLSDIFGEALYNQQASLVRRK